MPTLDEQLAASQRELAEKEHLLEQCLVQLAEAHRGAERARRDSEEASLRWQARLAEAGTTCQQVQTRMHRQQEELGLLQRELVRMAHESELRGAELSRALARMEELEGRLQQAEALAGSGPPSRLEPVATPVELTERLAELQAHALELEAGRARQEVELAERARDRSRLERELAGLQSERDRLAARVAEEQATAALREELAAARAAREEREVLVARVAEEEQATAALREELAAARAAREERDVLAARVAEEERAAATLREERDVLAARVAEEERAAATLREERDRLAARVAEEEQAAATLREELAAVQAAQERDGEGDPRRLAGRLFERATELLLPPGSRRRAVLRRFTLGRRDEEA